MNYKTYHAIPHSLLSNFDHLSLISCIWGATPWNCRWDPCAPAMFDSSGKTGQSGAPISEQIENTRMWTISCCERRSTLSFARLVLVMHTDVTCWNGRKGETFDLEVEPAWTVEAMNAPWKMNLRLNCSVHLKCPQFGSTVLYTIAIFCASFWVWSFLEATLSIVEPHRIGTAILRLARL